MLFFSLFQRSCSGLEWDKDGDVLCSICEKSSTLYMWDANLKKATKVDSGAKDHHSLLCWSKVDLLLAVGRLSFILWYESLSHATKVHER